ncbi:hypothetical protein QN326_p00020 (plasmid) [Candidatus Phytoplasma asteris]|uniref:Transmembrane protein n=1 Tax=Candidatus Phytoplasma asteris TaxID=85620 RepID=A0ABZ3CEN4_9MOLU
MRFQKAQARKIIPQKCRFYQGNMMIFKKCVRLNFDTNFDTPKKLKLLCLFVRYLLSFLIIFFSKKKACQSDFDTFQELTILDQFF